MAAPVRLAVVGSVNLDIVAHAERLPVAGETVTNATLGRYPGGKGANQALAAKRLGADVSLVACVGDDATADEALELVRAAGVDLEHCIVDAGNPTGVALIAVAASGENQIVVAPGANRSLAAERVTTPDASALVCQLEIPVETLMDLARRYEGMFCINLAPAKPVPDELLARADLLIVNETEAAYYGDRLHALDGIVAVTQGASVARLYQRGRTIAACRPPAVEALDTTGAGDAFCAALTIALVEGMNAERALAFACTAGALAATAAGAQPGMPERDAVLAALSRSTSRAATDL